MSKTYLPTEFINSNYTYQIDNDSIIINKHTNCTQGMGINYCDCAIVYPNNDYISTYNYRCIENSSYNIDYTSFTDDIYYRLDLWKILVIFVVLFIFIIYIPYRIISRLFGRWLKC